MQKFSRVYEWDQWSADLFKPYIRKAMELKITASGWPDECIIPNDPFAEQKAREEYIKLNEEKYGIVLDASKIEYNPGMRLLSKFLANSFWDMIFKILNFVFNSNKILRRWSLRNNLTKDLITNSPYELYKVLEDPKLVKGSVKILTEDLFAVPYKSLSDFAESHNKYNVVIALYTTAYARTILYSYLEKIYNAPNHKLLYTGA